MVPPLLRYVLNKAAADTASEKIVTREIARIITYARFSNFYHCQELNLMYM